MEKIKIEDLTLWEAFYWVAKRGSFTAAAGSLKIGVPFLSKKINRLEAELNLRLFNRTTRKVSLTPEAQTLLPRIEALLEEIGTVEGLTAPANELSGLIRVTSFPSLAQRCVGPAIVKFQKAYPKVQFELHVSDQLVDIVDSQMDIAIRVQAPVGAQFVFRKLLENRLILCAAPAYLKKHGKPKTPADLSNHPMLMLAVYANCRLFNSKARLGDFALNRAILCESGSLLTDLAIAGSGIAVRSQWDIKASLASGKLVKVLENFPLENFGDVYAVTPHRRFISNRVRRFLDFLQAEAKTWK